jgi:hypothetical protein
MVRKMTARQRRSVLLMIRLRPDEAREVREAAGLDPASTWGRVEILKAARRKQAKKKAPGGAEGGA